MSVEEGMRTYHEFLLAHTRLNTHMNTLCFFLRSKKKGTFFKKFYCSLEDFAIRDCFCVIVCVCVCHSFCNRTRTGKKFGHDIMSNYFTRPRRMKACRPNRNAFKAAKCTWCALYSGKYSNFGTLAKIFFYVQSVRASLDIYFDGFDVCLFVIKDHRAVQRSNKSCCELAYNHAQTDC